MFSFKFAVCQFADLASFKVDWNASKKQGKTSIVARNKYFLQKVFALNEVCVGTYKIDQNSLQSVECMHEVSLALYAIKYVR